MKSIKRFAYLGAIALVSAGFVACNNNEPTQEGNYNGETVKTQFTINLPNKVGNSVASKKMPVETVQGQATPIFTGMDNIVIIPFKNASAAAVTTASTRIGDNLVLNAASGSSDPANSVSALAANNNSKVYSDVSIPMGTNRFLFYGHSKNATLGDDQATLAAYAAAQKFQYGSLTVAGLSNADLTPAAISFTPVNICPSYSTNAKATALVTYLNTIAAATDASSGKWKDGGSDANQGWKDLYDEFITMEAGSSASVQAMVKDLYNEVKSNAAPMAVAIKAAILNNTYVSNVTEAAADATVELTFADAINGFPRNLHLPDGVAAIDWNTTTNAFEVVVAKGTNTGSIDYVDPAKMVYPASLYYYANSALKADKEIQSDKYDTKTTWEAIISDLYSASAAYVQNETRSVAIVDPIQYGVARLDTKVKANAATLKDKGEKTDVNVSDINMTGVIVGGQNAVGFDFKPAAAGELVVYDSILTTPNQALSTEYTQPNYTLVLESFAAQKVRMAVEFQNNTGAPFYGVNDQIIPAGGKFYIIAELDPALAASQVSGHTNEANLVFQQDYNTVVGLSLKTLANAYNLIPDLRAPEIELGFSVDLTWQAGKEFTLDID